MLTSGAVLVGSLAYGFLSIADNATASDAVVLYIIFILMCVAIQVFGRENNE